VVWLKDGNVLNVRTRKYRKYGMKKRLLVRNIMEEDSGMYECTYSFNSTEKGRAELWSECVCCGRCKWGVRLLIKWSFLR